MSLYELPKLPKINIPKIKISLPKISEDGKKAFRNAVLIILVSCIFGFSAGIGGGILAYSQIKKYLENLSPDFTASIIGQETAKEYIPEISQEKAVIEAVKNVSPAVVSVIVSKDMPWLLIAVLSYFFFAIVSLGDKYLLLGRPNPKIYVFYAGILGILAVILAPFVGFFVPESSLILLCLFVGAIYIFSLWGIFEGLEKYEASRIIPAIGGLSSFFVLIFGYFFSGGKEIFCYVRRGYRQGKGTTCQ